MPLRARQNGVDVFAFEHDEASWRTFKEGSKGTDLLMPCCDSTAIPKTSKLGNFFFAHKVKGDCTSVAESQQHLFIKGLIARSAKSAGWEVTTERAGESPSGDKWTADVYCTKGNAKIVFEVQLSKQTKRETFMRQSRYKESGVRCAWFVSDKVFKKNCFASTFVNSNKDTPFFRLISPAVGEDPMVDEFNVPLSELIIGMLNGKLSWEEEPWGYGIYYVDDVCWKCRKENKQVCGYTLDWYIERAKTVPNASTVLEDMLEKVMSNDVLAELGLNTIAQANNLKGNAPGFPYCNHCLHCGAPQNNYYLMQKIKSPTYEEDTDGLKVTEYISPSESSGSWVYKDK